jgi:hypothetical protein
LADRVGLAATEIFRHKTPSRAKTGSVQSP